MTVEEEEAQYRKRVEDFPQSPLPHFALGRFLLARGRPAEAVGPLEEAMRLQADYAAGLLSLADAYSAAGRTAEARRTFERAREVALAQAHPTLAEEIDDRLAELE
jgi:Flp pilus assembly protein TadD